MSERGMQLHRENGALLTRIIFARAFSMSTYDPSDPFESLLRRPTQPPPSLLEELLRSKSDPAPESLQRIQTLLKSDPYQSGSTAPVPTSDAGIPQKSIAQKIRDHLSNGTRLLSEGKVNKATGSQWIARLRVISQPIFGNVPYTKALDGLRKKAATSGLTAEEFSRTLSVALEFAEFLEATAGMPFDHPFSRPSRSPATKDVFVIHGHDEVNRLRLERLIRADFELNPIVLLDRPGRSAPTIEKFDQHAKTCSYAVALFTADDEIVTKTGDRYLQPRPNVMLETGWFVGRLGKERVLILAQDGVKTCSDFDGVNRIPFRDNIEEKYRNIQAELEEAGLI